MKLASTIRGALAIPALCGIGSFASAAVIYSNNFDSDSLGAVVAPFDDTGGSGSYFDVVAADASFATQHGELASRGDNGNYAFGNFDGGLLASDPGFASVTTFKFDLRLNSVTFPVTSQIRMRARDTGFSGGTTDTVRFDLDYGDLAADQVYSIQYVVNNSSFAATAPDQGSTIASGTYAIYVDGSATPFASGSNFTAADDLAVDKLTLWVKGDEGAPAQAIVQIDNWEVHTNVPEPTTIGMIGLGALGLLARRRRQ